MAHSAMPDVTAKWLRLISHANASIIIGKHLSKNSVIMWNEPGSSGPIFGLLDCCD